MKTSPSQADNTLIQWTGLAPEGTLHSLPLLNLNSNRKQILDYFNNSWTLTEVLFTALVKKEAFLKRPYHQLRHPLIFYYAHPAVLYVNKLRVAGLIDGPVHPAFEHLFEVGVDEMRWDDLHEGQEYVWPPLEDVQAYRKKVYLLIQNLIQTHPGLEEKNLPITQNSPLWSLVMGFEHERIHFETSSVLIRELPAEWVRKPAAWPELKNSKRAAPENKMLSVVAGNVVLGKPEHWPSFGWDNEYGNEIRSYASFAASYFLISNSEFREFVKAGGYSEKKYWTTEGWGWRGFRNTKFPAFWVPTGPTGLHEYQLRTTFEVIDMPWNWPVCVNFHEAKAYCVWRSEKDQATTPYRMPTEVEHQALRDSQTRNSALETKRDFVMTTDYKDKGYNINLSQGSESPVDAGPANDKGFYDTFGNVWQWSEDTFHPLPGSRPHPYYEDFSVPCYDGKHQMIFGGSFASTGDLASIWARFHFRPHFFQHAGFRIAHHDKLESATKNKPSKTSGSANYENKEMLDRYLLMHWGTDQQIWQEVAPSKQARPEVVHLPLKCAELVKKYSSHFDRALDLGCAVGRSTFEMAKDFKEVLGIDYSREFIDCAQKLKDSKSLDYWRKDSGSEGVPLKAQVDPSIDVNRLKFQQGDACALPADLKNFDVVLLANVLCRLPEPLLCLERLQGPNALIKRGGILVMTTPFSWLEEYTPKEKWLKGLQDVQKVLTEYDLIHEEECPFMIREHRRKFEYIITKASVWRRKENI